jgi:hypothetical protein
MGSRAGLDPVEKRKIPSLRLELKPPRTPNVQPVVSLDAGLTNPYHKFCYENLESL